MLCEPPTDQPADRCRPDEAFLVVGVSSNGRTLRAGGEMRPPSRAPRCPPLTAKGHVCRGVRRAGGAAAQDNSTFGSGGVWGRFPTSLVSPYAPCATASHITCGTTFPCSTRRRRFQMSCRSGPRHAGGNASRSPQRNGRSRSAVRPQDFPSCSAPFSFALSSPRTRLTSKMRCGGMPQR